MLNKKYRLSKNKDFEKVFRQGKFYSDKIVSLKFIPNQLDHNRFGIIVGLKVDRRAVVRNKVKRRLRSVIRSLFPVMKTSFDIILIAKPFIVGEDYQTIKEKIEKLFNKSGLLD